MLVSSYWLGTETHPETFVLKRPSEELRAFPSSYFISASHFLNRHGSGVLIK